MPKALSIVLKTVEICNLNCSYCYFFNGIDHSYNNHSAFISKETIGRITDFLKQGITELALDKISIGFHGGEPLLQKREDFGWACETFLESLTPDVSIRFGVQTNGIPINEKWIDLFEKYNVNVGVSIDGPKDYHDKYRVDHRGKGSYDKVVDRIKFYNEEAHRRGISSLGILSVINPEISGKVIYRHFVDELKLGSFNFLLPDNNYCNPPSFKIEDYGNFMCEVLDEWIKDDNPQISISFIDSTLGLFYGKESKFYGIGPSDGTALPLITISSDGDLSPVDELRSTDPSMMNTANVKNISLKNFLDHSIFKEIKDAQTNLPLECKECCWEKICGAGGIVNRFSIEKRFNNPSIYCESLKSFYAQLVKYLLNNGFGYEKLQEVLCL